ncbi:unnamed protein product [Ilex paraguariensis]|uniref:RING-type domain-containing protein n=1 Tax=Ilex paraguariensis TaxID=185542 RepID=A0ABC8UC26_9AQUA
MDDDPDYIEFLDVQAYQGYDQVQHLIEEQNVVVEVDDDEETEDDDYDQQEDQPEEDGEYDDQVYARFVTSGDTIARVLSYNRGGRGNMTSYQEAVSFSREGLENAADEANEGSQKRTQRGETSSCKNEKVEGGEEWNRTEIDGLFCPICMEAWTNGGDHQVCCLPCGHIYGMSCIKRWLQQRRSSGKCPQCNSKCALKDVRVLYASQIVAVNEELQKKVRSLEAKCASLEKMGADWCKKEVEWRKTEAGLHLQVHQLTERTCYLEGLLGDQQSKLSGSLASSRGCQGQATLGHNLYFEFDRQRCSSGFTLQDRQLEFLKFFG